jgi:hypothetical protein
MRRIIAAFLLVAGWLVADGADVTIAANAEARQILAPSGVLRAGLYTGAPSGLPSQIPRGRDQGMPFVRQFTRDVKSQGLVGTAIARAGLRGAVVSAPEKN